MTALPWTGRRRPRGRGPRGGGTLPRTFDGCRYGAGGLAQFTMTLLSCRLGPCGPGPGVSGCRALIQPACRDHVRDSCCRGNLTPLRPGMLLHPNTLVSAKATARDHRRALTEAEVPGCGLRGVSKRAESFEPHGIPQNANQVQDFSPPRPSHEAYPGAFAKSPCDAWLPM